MASHTASTTRSESTTTTPEPSSLLTIPPELRPEVYSYVLDYHFSSVHFAVTYFGEVINPDPPSVLRVCKLLREESIRAFDKRLTVMLEESGEIMAAAMSNATYHEKIWDLSQTSKNWTKYAKANEKDCQCRRDFDDKRKYVEQERALLRQEGFRV